MDFTGKYIESTYQKVLHIHSGSVYDGTGSAVSPTFSGSLTVIGDMIIMSGSVYVDGVQYEQQNSASITLDDSGSVQQISIDKNLGTHDLYYKYNESGSVIEVTSSFDSIERVTQFTRDGNDNIISWIIINN